MGILLGIRSYLRYPLTEFIKAKSKAVERHKTLLVQAHNLPIEKVKTIDFFQAQAIKKAKEMRASLKDTISNVKISRNKALGHRDSLVQEYEDQRDRAKAEIVY